MKKVISIMLAFVLCFSFPVSASALDISGSMIQPYYELADRLSSTLVINGSTATCKSSADGNSDIVKIVAVQTLEFHIAGFVWYTYYNTTWTKTVYSNSLTMSNTKSGLTNDKYRLKTDFTLTDKYGKSETITIYSSEKSVQSSSN